MTLELHPTGDCWVSLTVDGALIMKRVMRAGEKEVREVRETAVVEVGDAGAFAFSINGRPGKSLGQTGQVRTAPAHEGHDGRASPVAQHGIRLPLTAD